MKIKKHKVAFTLLCIFLAIILFIIGNIIYSNYCLTYSNYTVETNKIKGSVKMVVISDTEGGFVGKDNKRLIKKIDNANPEIVCIVGDMVEKNSNNYDSAISICKSLAKKYPTYYALGNHEVGLNDKLKSFENKISETGVTLLDNKMVDYKTKSGDKLTIAGIKDYPFFEYYAPDYNNDENKLFQSYLKQENNSHFSILLCHKPECYTWSFKDYNIDLMISGHTHGGIIRIPFVGGVYAPEQGYFPKYTKGYYKEKNVNLIITSGLNTSRNIPRFFNPLDVAVVTIKGK